MTSRICISALKDFAIGDAVVFFVGPAAVDVVAVVYLVAVVPVEILVEDGIAEACRC